MWNSLINNPIETSGQTIKGQFLVVGKIYIFRASPFKMNDAHMDVAEFGLQRPDHVFLKKWG
jgi:hypothetical protein